MTFSEHLKTWMGRNGLSVPAAAEALGTSRRTIENWRNGKPCQYEKAFRALMR